MRKVKEKQILHDAMALIQLSIKDIDDASQAIPSFFMHMLLRYAP